MVKKYILLILIISSIGLFSDKASQKSKTVKPNPKTKIIKKDQDSKPVINQENKELTEKLLNAIISDDLELVRHLLEEGADPHAINKEGYNALEWAWASKEEIKELIKQSLAAPKTKTASKNKTKPKEKSFTNSIGMEFVLIPAGEFMMGCSPGDGDCMLDEKPQKVKIAKPFYMSKYEVTQREWKMITGIETNLRHFRKCDYCPVQNVSWNDTQEFINKLNTQVVNTHKYRLPTEAEWEYAARAGTTTRYYWGNEIDSDYLWYEENSGVETHPVGQKKPNAFGLYDMLGNVWEWCNDWYDPNFRGSSKGFVFGSERALRGGSWSDDDEDARSSSRLPVSDLNSRSRDNGFRLVVSPD